MDASPISDMEIESYLNLHGYEDKEVRLFVTEIIYRLDDYWRSGLKVKQEDD